MLAYLIDLDGMTDILHLVHEQIDFCIINKKPFALDERKLNQVSPQGLEIYANELQDSLSDEMFYHGIENPDKLVSDYFKRAG